MLLLVLATSVSAETMIGVGAQHSCAIKNNAVRCWVCLSLNLCRIRCINVLCSEMQRDRIPIHEQEAWETITARETSLIWVITSYQNRCISELSIPVSSRLRRPSSALVCTLFFLLELCKCPPRTRCLQSWRPQARIPRANWFVMKLSLS